MTGVAVFLGIVIGVLGIFLLYCLVAIAIALKIKFENSLAKKKEDALNEIKAEEKQKQQELEQQEKIEQDEKNAAASNFKKKHKK
jgi:hypothetical protein